MSGYVLSIETPQVEDYCRLRVISGLSARSEIAASAGLPNTVTGAVVRYRDEAVGMGRVIGDGLFYHVVDIAVDPAHQRRGIGKMIMTSLMQELQKIAPAEAHVSLFADGDAHLLYSQFGFTSPAPASIGMTRWINR